MGIFQKFFGSEPKYGPLIKTCDLEMLRDAVLDLHQMAKERANRKAGNMSFARNTLRRGIPFEMTRTLTMPRGCLKKLRT